MKYFLYLISIISVIASANPLGGFQFGIIQRDDGVISLEEWKAIIEKDDSLEEMEDRVGINPFTKEEVLFPGEGKAYYIVKGERVGNISLDNGVLLTTGVPRNKCNSIGQLLRAKVIKDNRS